MSLDIEQHFARKMDVAAEGQLQEIMKLVRYRKELAWYARETKYKAHRTLYQQASRLLKEKLGL